MKISMFVFVLLFAQPIAVYANDASTGTGNELIQSCNQKEADNNSDIWEWCVSYVLGVGDGLEKAFIELGNISSGEKYSVDEKLAIALASIDLDGLFCMPNNVTRNQAALVVSKYLADNPDKLNKPEVTLVVDAFHKAWPCQPAKKQKK